MPIFKEFRHFVAKAGKGRQSRRDGSVVHRHNVPLYNALSAPLFRNSRGARV